MLVAKAIAAIRVTIVLIVVMVMILLKKASCHSEAPSIASATQNDIDNIVVTVLCHSQGIGPICIRCSCLSTLLHSVIVVAIVASIIVLLQPVQHFN